jgi:MFS family permease
VITIIDSSVVNIASPSIQEDFDATITQMVWVVAVYTLTFASTLLLFGKVGGRYGLRLFQALGAGIFGIASVLIAISPNIEFMLAMRMVEGLGAAMLGATGIALVNHIFKGKERSVAFGVWGALAGVGAALGPLLGGTAVTYLTWRWAFIINVPICIFVVAGCFIWVTEIKNKALGSIDGIGAFLSGAGLFVIVLGLIQATYWGWWKPLTDLSILGISPVPWCFVLGIALLFMAFPYWVQHRRKAGKAPIFELALFKFKSFRGGQLVALTRQMAQFAITYAVVVYLQETLGWSAMEAGAVFVGMAAGTIIGGPLSGKIANRFGTKIAVTGGIALMAAGIAWIAAVIGPDVSFANMVVALSVFGLGVGAAASQLNTVVMTDVPLDKSGDASASKAALQQVGNSLSAAFVGMLLIISISDVMIYAIIFAFIAMAISLILPNVRGGGGQPAGE